MTINNDRALTDAEVKFIINSTDAVKNDRLMEAIVRRAYAFGVEYGRMNPQPSREEWSKDHDDSMEWYCGLSEGERCVLPGDVRLGLSDAILYYWKIHVKPKTKKPKTVKLIGYVQSYTSVIFDHETPDRFPVYTIDES